MYKCYFIVAIDDILAAANDNLVPTIATLRSIDQILSMNYKLFETDLKFYWKPI